MNNKEIERIAIEYLKTKYKDVEKKEGNKGFDLYINRNRYELKATTYDKIYSRYLTESTYKEIMSSKYFGLIIVFNVNEEQDFGKMKHVILSNKKLRKMDIRPEKWYLLRIKLSDIKRK